MGASIFKSLNLKLCFVYIPTSYLLMHIASCALYENNTFKQRHKNTQSSSEKQNQQKNNNNYTYRAKPLQYALHKKWWFQFRFFFGEHFFIKIQYSIIFISISEEFIRLICIVSISLRRRAFMIFTFSEEYGEKSFFILIFESFSLL